MEKCTIIDGIASSEALDTSGEVVDLKGLDISSLVGAAINYEHKKDIPAQLVGKIVEAKKIFSKEDCENPRHLYYWNKINIPFLYIKARLLDDKKPSAVEVAALFKDDAEHPEEQDMLGFSVEGSKIEKVGAVITRSIARLVTLANMPANKTCIAEMAPVKEKKNDSNDISELFKGEMQLFSFEPSYIQIMDKKEELNKEEEGPIGHTRSGKPIHTNFEHPSHSSFTHEDHYDAQSAHTFHPKYHADADNHHKQQSLKHNATMQGSGKFPGMFRPKEGHGPEHAKNVLSHKFKKSEKLEKDGAFIGSQLAMAEKLEKAKVDEGKSITEKVNARSSRHLRDTEDGKHHWGMPHQQRASASEGYVKTTETGVHHPFNIDHPKGVGGSSAGMHAQLGEKDTAKKLHNKVLSEIKNSPSPKLGKTEKLEKDAPAPQAPPPPPPPPPMDAAHISAGFMGATGFGKAEHEELEKSGWSKPQIKENTMSLNHPSHGNVTVGKNPAGKFDIHHNSKLVGTTSNAAKAGGFASKFASRLGKMEKALVFGDPKDQSHIKPIDKDAKKKFVPSAKPPELKGRIDSEVTHTKPWGQGDKYESVHLKSGHVLDAHPKGKFKAGDKVTAQPHIGGTHAMEHSKVEKMEKSLTAGSGNAAPGQLAGGAVLGKENLDKKMYKKEKSKWYGQADDAYKSWTNREKFKQYMKKRMPHLAEGEVDAIGKVLALKKHLQAEKNLSKMYASHFIKSKEGKDN